MNVSMTRASTLRTIERQQRRARVDPSLLVAAALFAAVFAAEMLVILHGGAGIDPLVPIYLT